MKRITAIILILILSSFLGACTKDSNKESDGNAIDVYYVNSKTAELISESYNLIGTEINDQIDELLYMLQKTPDNAVYKSALPVDTEVNVNLDRTGSLAVNFDPSYNEFSGTTADILCRAVIVKTFCQLPEVDFIQFSIEGAPLQDLDGNVGALNSDKFVDNTEANTNYKAKLYYANEKGDQLVEYFADINFTGAEPIEKLVIQQLIKGPTETGMYRTIPEGTEFNVSKTDGICTVNFNDVFMEKLPKINPDVVIYSVVNSLVELPDINKVVFTVNGVPVKTFWEENKFDGEFKANLTLIEKPE